MGDFINYAHRGASEYAPENTLLSFYTGVYMGANGIETDVQRTRDGELVLFHDDTLTRVTGEAGTVADYTWAELQRFLVRRGALVDRIVRLGDFLKLFAFRDLTFAVELKVRDTEADVAALLARCGAEEKTVITSFDFENLRAMRRVAPQLRCGYLTVRPTGEYLAEMKALGIGEICPKAGELTAEDVRRYHEMGFGVRAWGVFDETLMRKVYDIGADGMTVNFPDKLTAYMAQARA